MGDEWDDDDNTAVCLDSARAKSYKQHDNGYGFETKQNNGDFGRDNGYGGGREGNFGGGGARASRPGDWNCSGCGKNNFASRNECFSCHQEKDESGEGARRGGGFGGTNEERPRAGQRPGDWNCSGCGKSNFASRNECFSCHQEKDESCVVSSGEGGRRRGGFGCNEGGEKPRAGQRPGDWTCPSCSKLNFASRTACFDCNEEKPAGLMTDAMVNEKPKEFYIPPDLPTDENEIFNAKIDQGINFNNFSKIPVKVTGENIPPAIRDFHSSGLREFLLTNVEKSGYTTPTPIQKHSIPIIMAGRDLMGCAQTGSGKTAAFLLPIINTLLTDNRDVTMGQPHVLIITPTRELCIQICEQAHKFAHKSYIRVQKIYGGTATRHQGDLLKNGVHILVATPGRLLDFVKRSYISFQDIRFLVLDEADRMLDMGFIGDIENVMTGMPTERQTLMFSATFPEEIQHLAGKYLTNYAFVTVGIVGGACTDVEQNFIEVSGRKKRDQLLAILNNCGSEGPKGVLVFLETKKSADFLASYLSETQFPTTSIHSDRLQKEREMALNDFKCGRMAIMIATSVAARGLDIPHVQHVINFDLPKSIDEYVHRIGRTGRLGNAGKATSFFDVEKDADIGGKLVGILRQANQPVPDFLEQYDHGAFSGQETFGGRDVRKNNGTQRPQAVAALVEDELW
ncbi:ATP-dependent RNA helicase vasa [Phlebotomus argentipes]|uniref:ATP-dependent RNA helicase vasa n=1 Tax=Phlebotomus argentipes TaxID=94469 RepID=UPI002892C62A|nr:ATP-dependent RNA helicase vasa [Phlebotomus argentipes]